MKGGAIIIALFSRLYSFPFSIKVVSVRSLERVTSPAQMDSEKHEDHRREGGGRYGVKKAFGNQMKQPLRRIQSK